MNHCTFHRRKIEILLAIFNHESGIVSLKTPNNSRREVLFPILQMGKLLHRRINLF